MYFAWRFGLDAISNHLRGTTLGIQFCPNTSNLRFSGSHRKRLLVHAGLHKTGTTALQNFLASAADDLRQLGVLYPRSGRVQSSHHNIAWQMRRDRCFVTSSGTIDDLANEVAHFDGDVLLSSEDFETLINEPARFAPLRLHPIFREHEFTLIIYLRNQSSYLESLYLEMLKHGIAQELIFLAHRLLLNRQLLLRESAIYFDYDKIFHRWMACGWANLIIRNYHQLAGNSIITDFCSILCPGLPVNASAASLRANVRNPLHSSVLKFYQNRVLRPLQKREEEIVAQICRALTTVPVALSNHLRFAFDHVFSKGNQALCSTAGLQGVGLAETGSAPAGSAPLERIFSFEFHNLIADSLLNCNIRELVGRMYAMLFAPKDPWSNYVGF